MNIQSLERRLDRLEASVPATSWANWKYEELERYDELLRKELAEGDGGLPLSSEELVEIGRLRAKAPRANGTLSALSIEELEARIKALDDEIRRLDDDPFSFI